MYYIAPVLMMTSLKNKLHKWGLREIYISENLDGLIIKTDCPDLDKEYNCSKLKDNWYFVRTPDQHIQEIYKNFLTGKYSKMYTKEEIEWLFSAASIQYHVLKKEREGIFRKELILDYYDTFEEGDKFVDELEEIPEFSKELRSVDDFSEGNFGYEKAIPS